MEEKWFTYWMCNCYRNIEILNSKKKKVRFLGKYFDENLLEDGVSILIADDDGPQST